MPTVIKKVIFLFLLALLSWSALGANRSIVVKVGGYDFAPFVERDGQEGLVRELIGKINSSQKKYHFEFVHTSANRRYKDFKLKKFDVILFEDESWSWKEKGINYARTSILAQGEEVAIALKFNRDQSYFESHENKKVRIILGFHYQINDMNTDQNQILKKGYEHGRSYSENVTDLLERKVDITFVNSFYLNRMLTRDKDLKDKILVAEKADHSFILRGLVHPSSPITVSELEKLGINKILIAND